MHDSVLVLYDGVLALHANVRRAQVRAAGSVRVEPHARGLQRRVRAGRGHAEVVVRVRLCGSYLAGPFS